MAAPTEPFRWRGEVMASGIALQADEWLVLCAYRDVRDAGAGVLIVELAGGACTKFECRNLHDAKVLTAAMGGTAPATRLRG